MNFAVRFRDNPRTRLKLSKLRFANNVEAREYAENLGAVGACSLAIVQLEGRRIISTQSIVTRATAEAL